MGFVGFFLVVVGFVMNVQVLRGPLRARMTSFEIMHTWPWMISVAFIAVGVLVLVLARG
jgi:hypothetical protein